MKKYIWFFASLLLTGCAWDNLGDQASAYPSDVAAILVHRCATSGCHNTASSEAAAGLNLDTWNTMYLGSRGGSAVIPYSPEQSYLLYAVNTDTQNGEPRLLPTMPIGGLVLTATEYAALKQWIADGARNLKGEERFPQDAHRRKWYVANQGCDLVAVFDAESKQIMRYVKVGASAGTESPHNVKVSKDGQYWYVVFLASNPYVEIYSTLTDTKVGQINIGNGSWNTFNISADGKFGVAVSFESGTGPGDLTVVIMDLTTLTVTEQLQFGVPVHGSAAHPTLRRFYITEQSASALEVIDYDSTGHVLGTDEIDLVQGVAAHNGASQLQPHEVFFTPDASKYFVTCQLANEVRVYDGTTNALLNVINVGDEPVEFAIDPDHHHIFVSCMNDITTFAGDTHKQGSVAIIDYNDNTLVKMIYTGYQPHGMAVDAASGFLIVANRNINPNGPAPHHTTSCGGRNGYLTAVDLSTLELVNGFKPEMSNDPYGVAVKH